MSSTVKLSIDGRDVVVAPETTILDAAWKLGIEIPILCHELDKTPIGVCRMCMVEAGGRPAAACISKVAPNMVVRTGLDLAPADAGEEVKKSIQNIQTARRTLLDLLMSEHPTDCFRQKQTQDCELERLAHEYGATGSQYTHREYESQKKRTDTTLPEIKVDHAACILCDRCVRACSELKGNFIIARHGKGHEAGITFDLDQPMGKSECVHCMECMYSCPTGALTKNDHAKLPKLSDQDKRYRRQFRSTESTFSTKELQSCEHFQHVSGSFLDFNRASIIRHEVKQGEVLFVEGDYGCTAFSILEGKVDISIESHGERVKALKRPGLLNILRKWKDWGRPQPAQQRANLNQVSVDASRDFPNDSLSTTLIAGDLFGEMTCLNSYPRSNTAHAATNCVLLELPRNVLLALKKDRHFRCKLEADYLERTLEVHLQGNEIFALLSKEAIENLRPNAELLSFNPGNTIFQQGKPADALYVIRAGFVKVSEMYNGRELILAYLSKGNFFGEIALVENSVHHATCSALDHVDVIRIPASDFVEIMKIDKVHEQVLDKCKERRKAREEREDLISHLPQDILEEYVKQGLQDAQSLLVLDLNKCTRCDQCVTACADAHHGISRLVRDGVRIHNFEVATACRHCYDPICMTGCPVGAIHRQDSLAVIIDDRCIGCGECEKRCPYGNIKMFEFAAGELPSTSDPDEAIRTIRRPKVATSCDLCHGQTPRCVQACPHDAAHRYKAEEFYELLAPKVAK